MKIGTKTVKTIVTNQEEKKALNTIIQALQEIAYNHNEKELYYLILQEIENSIEGTVTYDLCATLLQTYELPNEIEFFTYELITLLETILKISS